MCLPPSGSTGPRLPAVCDILSQQALGKEFGNNSYTWSTTKHIHVVYFKLHTTAAVIQQLAYPVNHQKRIFDRKEASLTGHGFCNGLKHRLVVFVVNHLQASETCAVSQRQSSDIWMMHLCKVCWIIQVCVNSTVQSGGTLWGAEAMNSHKTE